MDNTVVLATLQNIIAIPQNVTEVQLAELIIEPDQIGPLIAEIKALPRSVRTLTIGFKVQGNAAIVLRELPPHVRKVKLLGTHIDKDVILAVSVLPPTVDDIELIAIARTEWISRFMKMAAEKFSGMTLTAITASMYSVLREIPMTGLALTHLTIEMHLNEIEPETIRQLSRIVPLMSMFRFMTGGPPASTPVDMSFLAYAIADSKVLQTLALEVGVPFYPHDLSGKVKLPVNLRSLTIRGDTSWVDEGLRELPDSLDFIRIESPQRAINLPHIPAQRLAKFKRMHFHCSSLIQKITAVMNMENSVSFLELEDMECEEADVIRLLTASNLRPGILLLLTSLSRTVTLETVAGAVRSARGVIRLANNDVIRFGV